MKFKSTISILTLFILAIMVGYHSPLSPAAQAFSAEVEKHFQPEQTGPVTTCSDITEIPLIECQALEAFYNSTDGPNWFDNTGWFETNTPCSWIGITCSEGRVEGLWLARNQLSGTLPAELGNLTHLQTIELGLNELSGTIPSELGQLVNLNILHIYANQLTGEIPSELGNLANLDLFNLRDNQLSGPMPLSLTSLSALSSFDYSSQNGLCEPRDLDFQIWLQRFNLIGDDIEFCTGEATITCDDVVDISREECQVLQDVYNSTGSTVNWFVTQNACNWYGIECDMSGRPSITGLNLFDTRLSGVIPPQLGDLPNLQELSLSQNELIGEIPLELINLSNLQFLALDYNQLDGEIPPELSTLVNLQGLHIEDNQLSGEIPPSFTSLTGLENFSYGNQNGLCKPDDPAFQNWLAGVDTELLDRDDIELCSNDPPTTLSIEVSIAGDQLPRVLEDGTVIITFPRLFLQDVSIKLDIPFCADGTAPTAAFLNMITDDVTITIPMFDFETNTNTYIASIARFEIPVDNSTLNVRAVCSSGDESISVGVIRLYDPIGRVTDAITGESITSAEVTLYHVPGWSPRSNPADSRPNTCESNLSKAADAPWSQPAPIDQGVVADREHIPLAPLTSSKATNNDGFYGWDLPQGCWYVHVTAPGYQPLTSAVVGVPPAVTDLDLVLRPTFRVRTTPSLITTESGGKVEATLNLFNARAMPMVINLSSSGGTVQDLPETVTIEANSEQDIPFIITVPNQPGTSRISVVATAQDDPNIRDEALIFVEVPRSGISFGSQVLLERRGENNHSGATVCVGNNCTTTSDEGFYRLENAPASGTVVASHPGYLSVSYRYSFGEGGPPFIPVIELLGGDTNASGAIDVDDAVLMGLALNSRPGDAHWNATADITDDGIVDQRDMDAVQFNWGETAE